MRQVAVLGLVQLYRLLLLLKAKLSNELLSVIDDSKSYGEVSESLCEAVKPLVAFGYGIASVQEIDKFNILNATMLSMRRAVSDLPVNIDLALVDGNKNPEMGF